MEIATAARAGLTMARKRWTATNAATTYTIGKGQHLRTCQACGNPYAANKGSKQSFCGVCKKPKAKG